MCRRHGRSRGIRRCARRRDRDWALPFFISAGYRTKLNVALWRHRGCCANDRQGARRALRHPRERAAIGSQAKGGSATRGYSLRRPPLGQKLYRPFSSDAVFELQDDLASRVFRTMHMGSSSRLMCLRPVWHRRDGQWRSRLPVTSPTMHLRRHSFFIRKFKAFAMRLSERSH